MRGSFGELFVQVEQSLHQGYQASVAGDILCGAKSISIGSI